jgi:hypothetical protein
MTSEVSTEVEIHVIVFWATTYCLWYVDTTMLRTIPLPTGAYKQAWHGNREAT